MWAQQGLDQAISLVPLSYLLLGHHRARTVGERGQRATCSPPKPTSTVSTPGYASCAGHAVSTTPAPASGTADLSNASSKSYRHPMTWTFPAPPRSSRPPTTAPSAPRASGTAKPSWHHQPVSPADIAVYPRGHWEIENRLHWVREVTYGGDAFRMPTGTAPRAMAILRNVAINALHQAGHTDIATGPRHMAHNPTRPLQLLGITPDQQQTDFATSLPAEGRPHSYCPVHPEPSEGTRTSVDNFRPSLIRLDDEPPAVTAVQTAVR